MSMSQEEIEALMNGLDVDESQDSSPEAVEEVPETSKVNMDEIEELISETQDETSVVEEVKETIESVSVDNSDIDDLINSIEEEPASAVEKDIDQVTEESFDDVLAGVDGIVESKPVSIEEKNDTDNHEMVRDWTDTKINQGIFPLPAEDDTKVVSQLSQVANDSEEKVGQIFDVLSLTLDNNNELRNKLKAYNDFVTSQTELLNSLTNKFPNISVLSENLETANTLSITKNELDSLLNAEDMKIFEAMELMQFNDINRQKIERVMAVIRKLSAYLNNLFEDDKEYQDISVAKHIHGDSTENVVNEDDLNKLIEEFEN